MVATLYTPGQQPHTVPADGLPLLSSPGVAQVTEAIASYLGCVRSLVDVLDSGPGYVAYSIFDVEGQVNLPAMDALSTLSGHRYDIEDDDQVLQGPILVITA